jgi:hypothetical protein
MEIGILNKEQGTRNVEVERGRMFNTQFSMLNVSIGIRKSVARAIRSLRAFVEYGILKFSISSFSPNFLGFR